MAARYHFIKHPGSAAFIHVSSYFDCEVRTERAGNSQDLLIRELLEVQRGVLQVVLARSIQRQLTFDPLEGLTLQVCRGKSRRGLEQRRQTDQSSRGTKISNKRMQLPLY